MVSYIDKCERCGRLAPVEIVENLPIYRLNEDGELIYVGINTKLCKECIEDYTVGNNTPDPEFIKLNMPNAPEGI